MFKILRKADVILFFVLLALGAVLSLAGFIGKSADSASNSARVEIRVGGELFGSYDLNTNQEVLVNQGTLHQNKVIIKDGQVQMEEASCHNQVCVKQGTISRPGQTIICLPNKVVVEIISDDPSQGGETDVISG